MKDNNKATLKRRDPRYAKSASLPGCWLRPTPNFFSIEIEKKPHPEAPPTASQQPPLNCTKQLVQRNRIRVSRVLTEIITTLKIIIKPNIICRQEKVVPPFSSSWRVESMRILFISWLRFGLPLILISASHSDTLDLLTSSLTHIV